MNTCGNDSKNRPGGKFDIAIKGMFVICMLAIMGLCIANSRQAILELHSFRQTQTALTAYYLIQNGFSLRYETPVVGEPWSIPYELPIYQLAVATVSSVFDMHLTQTGRIMNMLFTVLACFPIYAGLIRPFICPCQFF